MNITKEDIKKNGYNLILVGVYTFILNLVYGCWVQSALNIWWVTLLIVVVITVGGLLTGIYWTKSEIKKNTRIEK